MPSKWKCPRCQTWVVEDMGRVCTGCKNTEAQQMAQLALVGTL